MEGKINWLLTKEQKNDPQNIGNMSTVETILKNCILGERNKEDCRTTAILYRGVGIVNPGYDSYSVDQAALSSLGYELDGALVRTHSQKHFEMHCKPKGSESRTLTISFYRTSNDTHGIKGKQEDADRIAKEFSSGRDNSHIPYAGKTSYHHES